MKDVHGCDVDLVRASDLFDRVKSTPENDVDCCDLGSEPLLSDSKVRRDPRFKKWLGKRKEADSMKDADRNALTEQLVKDGISKRKPPFRPKVSADCG